MQILGFEKLNLDREFTKVILGRKLEQSVAYGDQNKLSLRQNCVALAYFRPF